MIRLLATGLLLSSVSTAVADVSPGDISISAFNPAEAVAPASTVEGPGIKVGEGTVVHPVLGVETGFISNAFYEESDEQPVGILRLLAQVGAASLHGKRLHPSATVDDTDGETTLGSFEYRASLRLSYDLVFSDNDAAEETGGLGIGASLHGLVNPMGRLAFGFDDDFVRLIRAANFETDANTNRDINNLRLLMLYKPYDRSISGYLYYDNQIDIFERDEQSFADRMTNRVGLHPQWRFLPQTQAYLDLSIANVTALDDNSTKSDSYPLVLRAGLATLLSVKTTLNLEAGYTNGFYSEGPSFSAPVVGAQLGYRYSPLGRFTLGYTWQYSDSINANYYRDHIIHGSIQQIYKPVVFMVQPEVHFRQYRGVTVAIPGTTEDTRDDFILAVVGGIHYNFRDWFTATLNYRFSTVQTDYMDLTGGTPDDPSFTRHEILAGVRVAW